MVLERRHFLQTRRGGHHDPGAKGTRGAGGEADGATRTQPLNAPSTPRACWRSTASAGHWKGRRRPCSSRLGGGATGSGAACRRQRQSIIRLQSLCRGHLQRQR